MALTANGAQARFPNGSRPKPEREVFELYFVEGFEPAKIAMVLGVSVKEAEVLLAAIRGRVCDALLEQSAV